MELCAAAARRLRAELGGDHARDAGRRATDWMVGEGVVDVDAMTGLVVPGFGGES